MRLILKSGRAIACRRRTATLLWGLMAGSMLLVGGVSCSRTDAVAKGTGQGAGRIQVVASTDVYGDIAASIGGAQVTVTAMIDRSAQDPHAFEASVRDQLAVSRADVVIRNGGGYDDFMGRLLDARHGEGLRVLDAVQVAHAADPRNPSLDSSNPAFNEHVFYDLAAMRALARRLAVEFGRLDPRHADDFTRRAARFSGDVRELQTKVAELERNNAGDGVLVTEALPMRLLDAIGLVNRTPAGLSAAVEEGGAVAPRTLRRATELLSSGRIALLATNAQTSGPTTERLVDVARQHRVPVVAFSETLASGVGYVAWMRGNIATIHDALVHHG